MTFDNLNIEHRGMMMGQLHDFHDLTTGGNFTMPIGFTEDELRAKLATFRQSFLHGAMVKVAPGFMPSRSQVIAGISSVFQ